MGRSVYPEIEDGSEAPDCLHAVAFAMAECT